MKQSINAEVTFASQICGNELSDFIQYVQKNDPGLKHSEAIMVGAIILHELPSAFAGNPQMLDELNKVCKTVKQRRK